jgi:DNA polymerase I-like protein with 3'-5' exonuclease and polymerase domains
LDPSQDTPLLIGIGDYVAQFHTGLDLGPLLQVIEERGVVKVFHNAAFDGMFLQQVGCLPRRVMDTMIGANLLKLGRPMDPGAFSLGNLLYRGLGVSHDKELQTSFVGADAEAFVPTQEQLDYLHRDVRHLPALAEWLAEQCQRRGLGPTWKLENAYTQVIAMMQLHGPTLDVEAYKLDLAQAELDFQELETKLDSLLTPHILEVRRKRFEAAKAKYDEWQGWYADVKAVNAEAVYGPGQPVKGTKAQLEQYNALNKVWVEANTKPARPVMSTTPILVTSPQQIADAISEMGIDVPDTQRDHLYIARADYPEHEEVLTLLGDLSVARKIRANEGELMLSRLQDGVRLSTRYWQMKDTGRMGSSKWKDRGRDVEWGMNMQNLTAKVKQHVHPDPGMTFVIGDYAQIELRVATELALIRDETANDALVQAFRDGKDPHSMTAATVLGEDYDAFMDRLAAGDADAKTMRQAAKVTNFSTTFFIGAPKLAVGIYVARKDTRPFTKKMVKEAQDFIDAFWALNPTVHAALLDLGEQAVSLGYTTTLGGRRRYYDTKGKTKWELGRVKRQAANQPIQGTAADICKLAQASIYDIMTQEPTLRAYIWAAVHDEIALACPEGEAGFWWDTLVLNMDEAFTTYITHVPCEISSGVHDSWTH